MAHIQQQGVDLIIVPLNPAFGMKSQGEKQQFIDALQRCADAAGLAGTVIPVWTDGAGRMAFLAPRNWHPFFASLSYNDVLRNLNRELTCYG